MPPKFKSCSECVPRGVPLWTGPALCKGDCTWNAGKCEAKSPLSSCLGPDCNQRPACLGPSCDLPTAPTSWPCSIGPGCHPPEHPEDPEPVDSVWSAWGVWGECSQSCGRGSRTRTRQCSPPSNGGKPCQGPADETEACFSKPCSGGSILGVKV